MPLKPLEFKMLKTWTLEKKDEYLLIDCNYIFQFSKTPHSRLICEWQISRIYLQISKTDKGLVSRIYKKLLQMKNKKQEMKKKTNKWYKLAVEAFNM